MKTLFILAIFGTLSAYAASPIQNVYLEGKFGDGIEQGATCRISYSIQEENGKQLYNIADFDIFNNRGQEKYNTGLLKVVSQVKKMSLSRNGYVGTGEWKENGKQYDMRIRFSGRDLTDPGSIHTETRQGSFLFGTNGEVGCKGLKVISRTEFYRGRVNSMAKDQIGESRMRCERAARIRAVDREQTSGLARFELDTIFERDFMKCDAISEARLKNLQKVEINEYESLPNSSVDFAETKLFKELDRAPISEDSGNVAADLN